MTDFTAAEQIRQGLNYIEATYGVGAMTTERGKRDRPVSETAAPGVTVIDQAGEHHNYDADRWALDDGGHLDVMKDGKLVATFAPGFLGVYKPEYAR